MNQPENNNPAQDSSGYSEEWLSAYIDDELTDAQRAIVEQRLAGDSEAQQLLDDLRRVRGLVHQLPAWSGKLISASDVTPISGGATVLPTDVAVDNGSDHAGDYHDELQNESHLHSESIVETLEQEGGLDSAIFDAPTDVAQRENQGSLEGFAYSGQPHVRSWLRPLALAACLLLLLGGVAWIWNLGSSWTVATSTDGGRELQEAKSSTASATKAEAEAVKSRDALRGSSDDAFQPLAKEARDSLYFGPQSAPAAALPPPNPMAREQAPMAAAEPTQESLAAEAANRRNVLSHGESKVVEGSLGEGLADNAGFARNDRAKEELGTEQRSVLGGRLGGGFGGSTNDGAAMLPTLETEVLGRGRPGGTSTKVQLAHSAGWSARDIEAALERLAPLLNLPTAQFADRAIADAAAAIPIAIVTPKPPATGATPLGNVWQQQAVPLQEVVPADSRPLAWQAPFAQSIEDEPSTVALFVLREEAEQILQAARQAGELVNKPVWISSASGTPVPASPKQQVVLLFAPQ